MRESATETLAEAYAFCREVARHEAKNFYYAFRVLPKAKSDAMCAVYAFMRRADDLADDESLSVDDRRIKMRVWLDAWRAARGEHASGRGNDPVFLALTDTQRQFGISDNLLEDLVRGTSMDLGLAGEEGSGSIDLGGGLQGYATFQDLYRYCYYVASVVGLVCIRIFGYSDAAAEMLAERTGVAFQLTNILRDVKEDAKRMRIYLPQDLLREFGVSKADVLALAGGRRLRANERKMLGTLSAGAWSFYESGAPLLKLIDRDSRAALWVMVDIYSRLLRRIDARRGDVFSTRVRVPATQKIVALGRGLVMSLGAERE